MVALRRARSWHPNEGVRHAACRVPKCPPPARRASPAEFGGCRFPNPVLDAFEPRDGRPQRCRVTPERSTTPTRCNPAAAIFLAAVDCCSQVATHGAHLQRNAYDYGRSGDFTRPGRSAAQKRKEWCAADPVLFENELFLAVPDQQCTALILSVHSHDARHALRVPSP